VGILLRKFSSDNLYIHYGIAAIRKPFPVREHNAAVIFHIGYIRIPCKRAVNVAPYKSLRNFAGSHVNNSNIRRVDIVDFQITH